MVMAGHLKKTQWVGVVNLHPPAAPSFNNLPPSSTLDGKCQIHEKLVEDGGGCVIEKVQSN